jgi:hypothetical protein
MSEGACNCDGCRYNDVFSSPIAFHISFNKCLECKRAYVISSEQHKTFGDLYEKSSNDI